MIDPEKSDSEERDEEECPVHFEENIVNCVESGGDEEAFNPFTDGENFFFLDAEPCLDFLWPVDGSLVGDEIFFCEKRNAIIVAENCGEHDVCES